MWTSLAMPLSTRNEEMVDFCFWTLRYFSKTSAYGEEKDGIHKRGGITLVFGELNVVMTGDVHVNFGVVKIFTLTSKNVPSIDMTAI